MDLLNASQLRDVAPRNEMTTNGRFSSRPPIRTRSARGESRHRRAPGHEVRCDRASAAISRAVSVFRWLGGADLNTGPSVAVAKRKQRQVTLAKTRPS